LRVRESVFWNRVARNRAVHGVAVLGLVGLSLSPQIMPKLVHDAAVPAAVTGAPVAVKPVPAKPTPKDKTPANYQPAHDAWPGASSGTAKLAAAVAPSKASTSASTSASAKQGSKSAATAAAAAAPAPAPVQVAGTPVWLEPVKAGAATPSSVSVSVLSHQAATNAGIDGVLLTAASAAGSGGVRLGLDYGSFAQAYGGDYGSRLSLVELPACALTTPKAAACRVEKKLSSTNDATGQSVSAAVTLATPAAAGRLVLAAVSAASGGDGGGAAGQFGATSLKPAGTWSAGGVSGAFDYQYPISVPQSLDGFSPQVGLSYDSGSVDGQTSATDSQADWLGDGWSTPENFVEQSFVSCADDPEGSAAPEATQDECYDGPILTLSLNGSSIELVCNDAETSCKASDDDGDIVTHVVPSSSDGSGTYNSDYWTVQDRSGTTYYFGMNELPGWKTNDPMTNSVAYEPVYSANSGDPCYNATWADSVCTMAYRWNLDYATDIHGQSMAYYYTQSMNAYAQNGDTTANATPYVRDDYLTQVDYGFTDGDAYTATAPDRVVFGTGDRCLTGTCDPLSSTTAADWPDVPYDLNCAAGSACDVTSPSFWSTVRLTSITTQQYNGTAYEPIDTYNFTQTIPSTSDGTAPTLWLSSISHVGSDTSAGGSAVTLPSVSFTPIMLANRADITDGLPALDRYRIAQIETETGSVIGVTYELTNPCGSPVTITPSDNSSSCYPVYWTPSGDTNPYLDWFNKYAVHTVSQSDPTGGSTGLFTRYNYVVGPAWHYDDNELVQAKYRTYGQFRGYGDVQTFSGQGADPVTESETWYYLGMSDDNDSTAVTLTDSQGGQHDDTDELADQTLETAQYFYSGGPVASSTINDYWVSPATATRDRTGLPALTANLVVPTESWTRTAVTDTSPSTWQETADVTSYDSNTSDADFGLPLYSMSTGDLSLFGTAQSQATCTQKMYTAPNTALNLVGLVAETQVTDKPCGGSSAIGSSTPTAPAGGQINGLTTPSGLNLATDLITDTRTFYDDPTLAATWPQPAAPTWPQAAPDTADISVSQAANGYSTSTGALTYETKSASVYDSYGRPTATYDALGNKTTDAYTDTSYGTATGTSTTNALNQTQTTTVDPTRSMVTSATDANGITTTVHYDGLGRTTAVWYYGRATSTAASEKYSYAVSQTAATAVTTQTLNEESGYSTSVNLYDALLRLRQTQTPSDTAGVDGRIISDTEYDSHGWVVKTNTNYYDTTSSPNTTLVTADSDNLVDDQTLTSYNGLGEPVEVQSLDNASDPTVDDITYYEDTGDKSIVVPPAGGVAQATVTDALGRTTGLEQYTAAPTVTTGTAGGFTTVSITGGTTSATQYTFNAHGLAYQTIDANGDTSSTGYDFLGEATSQTDPNAGESTTEYDADGNVIQTTDSMGNSTSYKYDALGRKTAEYDAPVADQQNYSSAADPGNETGSWTYDNANKVSGVTDAIGELTAQTSYTSAGVFSEQDLGFNSFGESTGESYTVPGSTSLAGTYTYRNSYTPVTGLEDSNLIPAAGGMAQEITTQGYVATNGLDEPNSFGGLNGYTQNITYTAWGQVSQEEIGNGTNDAYVANTYDSHTGALKTTSVENAAVSGTPIDQTAYTYDASGNPTSETETRSGTQTETQCFTYDTLDRLNDAWTAASNSCGTTPTTSNASTVVGDGISGGAYWEDWSFDDIGQVKQEDQYSPSTGSTSTSYVYGANDASECDGQTSTGVNTLSDTTTTASTGSATSYYCSNADGETTSMPSSTGQNSLSWTGLGQLESVTTPSSGTGYVYDANGDLVERTDPDQVTVYLPDQQIVLDTGNGQTTTTRFIGLPGGGSVIETGSTSDYSFYLSNPQGTSTMSLNSTLTTASYQQYTPYGAQRGAAPASWTDPDGFLGATEDGTGSDQIVDLSARQYVPALGRFLSLDPVLENQTPEELNGYTYAGDNPVANSDPSGDMYSCPVREPCITLKGKSGNPPPTTTPPTTTPGSTSTSPSGPAPDPCAGVTGKMAELCYHDSAEAADEGACDASCEALDAEAGECTQKGGVFMSGVCTVTPPPQPHHWWDVVAAVVAVVVVVAIVAVAVVQPELLPAALEAGEVASDLATEGSVAAEGAVDVGAEAAADGTEATADAAEGGSDAAETSDEAVDSASDSSDSSPEDDACSTNSFVAQTGVLLASGKVVPISKVKAGDVVATADPGAAKGAKDAEDTVAGLIVTKDDASYTKVTVESGGKQSTIDGTAFHLYWDASTHAWTQAYQLKAGDELQTVDGRTVRIVSLDTTELASGPDPITYNLSVDGLHDYFVDVDGTPVLVHNCPTQSAPKTAQELADEANKFASRTMNTVLSAGTNMAMSAGSQYLNSPHGDVSVPQVLEAGLAGGVFGATGFFMDTDEMAPSSYIVANMLAGAGTDMAENGFDQAGNHKPFNLGQLACWGLVGGASGAVAGGLGAIGEARNWGDHIGGTVGTAYSLGSSSANLMSC
jgi:RHS repeat-associated protein